ncbi:MAG: peptide chain release factor N(5)-glutamine methyltransferase, partial [Lachnospiraceae bacterium]|nr:peptide chain release factor N(5)-glutamine methyltransferase [Lachnospiraceae bacterium]
EPLQHILGYTEFMGLRFCVNEKVLCPRQDTECLVELVQSRLKANDRILDLCTGSGCILISLLSLGGKAAPAESLTGIGVDISEDALSVARKNGEQNKVNVKWLQGDIFGALDALEPGERSFDVITANPPYIPHEAIWGIMPEVRDHEPHIALDGGEHGLDFYERIIPNAKDYLTDGGMLAVEIGYDQGTAVKQIFEAGGYRDIEIHKDLSGNDRDIVGIK